MVEIKLTIVWLDLNFKFFIIFWPTVGVIAKKTKLQLSTIDWLFFLIDILLYFFFIFLEIFLFLSEMKILSYLIDDFAMPAITEDVIFPHPINPKFIDITISIKLKLLGKKKAPKKGAFKFFKLNFY